MQVIDLLAKDTYDELVFKKLHGKGAMSDALIDGKEIDALKQYFADMNISFKSKSLEEEKDKNIFTLLDGNV